MPKKTKKPPKRPYAPKLHTRELEVNDQVVEITFRFPTMAEIAHLAELAREGHEDAVLDAMEDIVRDIVVDGHDIGSFRQATADVARAITIFIRGGGVPKGGATD